MVIVILTKGKKNMPKTKKKHYDKFKFYLFDKLEHNNQDMKKGQVKKDDK